jgi:mannose-6-phosphate isomerase
VAGLATDDAAVLAPGAAVLVTPNERGLRVSGSGELFVALPGR